MKNPASTQSLSSCNFNAKITRNKVSHGVYDHHKNAAGELAPTSSMEKIATSVEKSGGTLKFKQKKRLGLLASSVESAARGSNNKLYR